MCLKGAMELTNSSTAEFNGSGAYSILNKEENVPSLPVNQFPQLEGYCLPASNPTSHEDTEQITDR